MLNPFSELDAQSEESRMAQVTPEEHGDYQAWLDMVQAQNGEMEFEPTN